MTEVRKCALELLRSPDFFSRLLSAVRKAGLVGEERNALVVFIVATSRLLAKPLCLFVKGRSGVGKNFLADTVLRFFPSAELRQPTSISDKALNYLGDTLVHKIFYVRERNESAGRIEPIRLLISEQALTHIVTVKKRGKLVAEYRETKGPVAAISTTTKNRLQVDDETRHVSVWLNESPEQTRRIVAAAVDRKAGLTAREMRVWHHLQRIIQRRSRVPVEFPEWFRQLAPFVRNDSLWTRRYFPAFLQACRTVALIRAFRGTTHERRRVQKILCRFSDFAITALIFNAVFEQSIDKANDGEVETQEDVRFISLRTKRGVSANELADEKHISYDQASARLRDALNAGTIRRANQPSKSNLKLFLPSKAHSFLPDPSELFFQIDGVPKRVKFVHPLTGEWVTYERR